MHKIDLQAIIDYDQAEDYKQVVQWAFPGAGEAVLNWWENAIWYAHGERQRLSNYAARVNELTKWTAFVVLRLSSGSKLEAADISRLSPRLVGETLWRMHDEVPLSDEQLKISALITKA